MIMETLATEIRNLCLFLAQLKFDVNEGKPELQYLISGKLDNEKRGLDFEDVCRNLERFYVG